VYALVSGRSTVWLLVYLALAALFVWLFGENVEDRTGHGRFLALYVICGAAAALFQSLMDPALDARIAGMGGATAGVMGAYVILYPQSRVVALIPGVTFVRPVEVPSVYLMAFWFVLQWSTGTLGAHLAAFATGMCGVLVVRRPERLRVEWWNEVRPRLR
jgi:membrane associated rhomboid family serine protease